jgi:hypothetical protein
VDVDVDGGVNPWPKEYIPDEDILFRWIHEQWFYPDGKLKAGYFQQNELSVRWGKYATAETTHRGCPNPSINAIISFVAGEVRAIEDLLLEHTPLPQDQAHSDIKYSDAAIRNKAKKTKARFLLSEIYTMAISLEHAKSIKYDD